MKTYGYGQQPSDLKKHELKLGWLAGVRHLKAGKAAKSFWHVHEEIQFLYCFKGEYVYEFRDKSQTVLTAGHLIVIPAGMEHRHLQAIDPAGHRVEMLVKVEGKGGYCTFPPKVAEGLVADILAHTCEAVPCRNPLPSLFASLDAIAADAAKRPATERELALARTLSCLILQKYAEQVRAAPEAIGHAGKSDAAIVREAIQWMERRFCEKIRIPQLVAYIGYSRSRLFEIFKRHAGLSPADWLVRYRIKRAGEMLAAGGTSAAAVGKACGFSSPQYFNSVFRKQTGVPPSQWASHISSSAAPAATRL